MGPIELPNVRTSSQYEWESSEDMSLLHRRRFLRASLATGLNRNSVVSLSEAPPVDAQPIYLSDPLGIGLPRNYRMQAVTSTDPTGRNEDYRRIGPNQGLRVDIPDAGVITHLWTTTWVDSRAHKDLRIAIYWDGNAQPSVDCPLGTFFGQGWGQSYEFVSRYLSVLDKRGLNSSFRMPFTSGARIELLNLSAFPVEKWYFNIEYAVSSQPLTETRRFCAQSRQHLAQPVGSTPPAQTDSQGAFLPHPSDDGNYIVFDATGPGQLVGVNVYLDATLLPSSLWPGEGNFTFRIDGETFQQSMIGTGWEDWFDTAWSPTAPSHTQDSGLAYADGGKGYAQRAHWFRYLMPPWPFHQSARLSVELGHANRLRDWLSVESIAYSYSDSTA